MHAAGDARRQGARGALRGPAEIDTVLCMFTDLQGRFMGKRVLPDFFLEEILGEEGLHACLYLLAIDMEMEPLPGYEYASWETGYGDFRMIPDLTTLRWCPWLEKTAMVHLRHRRRGHERAGRGRAPPDPEAIRSRSAAAAGVSGQDRVGARVLPVQGLVRRSGGARIPRPAAELHVHHGLPHAADHEGRVVHPPDPQRHARRRHPGRVLEGRVRQGPARDQHHLLRTRCRTPTTTRSTSTVRRRSPRSTAWRSRSWRSGRWPRPVPRATSIPACGTWTARSRSCGTATRRTT